MTDKLTQSEHEHQFSIPVEYKIFQNNWNTGGEYVNTPGMAVTKLRCLCGEETERNESDTNPE